MNAETEPFESSDPIEILRELVRRWDDGGFYEQGHENLIEAARNIVDPASGPSEPHLRG